MVKAWVGVTLGAVLALVAGCSESPDEREFATCGSGEVVADPLASGEGSAPGAGQLISVDAVEQRQGAQVWRIEYCTTGKDGDLVPVSGLVIAPDTPAPEGGFPVIAWAHGSLGLNDECAQSTRGAQIIPYLPQWVEAGYAIVASDYEGLGTPGTPPYLVGQSEARSILDSLRAAGTMSEANTGPDTVIVGHSQGGHAALFAGQLASSYAPEQNIVGVAALAPPTDLAAIGDERFGSGAGFSTTSVLIAAWVDYYELDASQLLTEEGLEALDMARNSCANVEGLEGPDEKFLKEPITENPQWVELLEENFPGQRPTEAPIFIMQGDTDALVSAESTMGAVPRLCETNPDLRFRLYADTTHGGVLTRAAPDLFEFTEDAFAGQSTSVGDDCSTV